MPDTPARKGPIPLLEKDARWDKLLVLLQAGHGQYEAAEILDIHPRTIERYLRAHPAAKEEVLEAKTGAAEPVLAALRQMALNDEVYYDEEGRPWPGVRHADRISAAKAYFDWLTRHDKGTASLLVKHEHTHTVDVATIQDIAELAKVVQDRQAIDVESWAAPEELESPATETDDPPTEDQPL